MLIAEIREVERFEQQASEHAARLEDDLAHLVLSRGAVDSGGRLIEPATLDEREQWGWAPG